MTAALAGVAPSGGLWGGPPAAGMLPGAAAAAAGAGFAPLRGGGAGGFGAPPRPSALDMAAAASAAYDDRGGSASPSALLAAAGFHVMGGVAPPPPVPYDYYSGGGGGGGGGEPGSQHLNPALQALLTGLAAPHAVAYDPRTLHAVAAAAAAPYAPATEWSSASSAVPAPPQWPSNARGFDASLPRSLRPGAADSSVADSALAWVGKGRPLTAQVPAQQPHPSQQQQSTKQQGHQPLPPQPQEHRAPRRPSVQTHRGPAASAPPPPDPANEYDEEEFPPDSDAESTPPPPPPPHSARTATAVVPSSLPIGVALQGAAPRALRSARTSVGSAAEADAGGDGPTQRRPAPPAHTGSGLERSMNAQTLLVFMEGEQPLGTVGGDDVQYQQRPLVPAGPGLVSSAALEPHRPPRPGTASGGGDGVGAAAAAATAQPHDGHSASAAGGGRRRVSELTGIDESHTEAGMRPPTTSGGSARSPPQASGAAALHLHSETGARTTAADAVALDATAQSEFSNEFHNLPPTTGRPPTSSGASIVGSHQRPPSSSSRSVAHVASRFTESRRLHTADREMIPVADVATRPSAASLETAASPVHNSLGIPPVLSDAAETRPSTAAASGSAPSSRNARTTPQLARPASGIADTTGLPSSGVAAVSEARGRSRDSNRTSVSTPAPSPSLPLPSSGQPTARPATSADLTPAPVPAPADSSEGEREYEDDAFDDSPAAATVTRGAHTPPVHNSDASAFPPSPGLVTGVAHVAAISGAEGSAADAHGALRRDAAHDPAHISHEISFAEIEAALHPSPYDESAEALSASAAHAPVAAGDATGAGDSLESSVAPGPPPGLPPHASARALGHASSAEAAVSTLATSRSGVATPATTRSAAGVPISALPLADAAGATGRPPSQRSGAGYEDEGFDQPSARRGLPSARSPVAQQIVAGTAPDAVLARSGSSTDRRSLSARSAKAARVVAAASSSRAAPAEGLQGVTEPLHGQARELVDARPSPSLNPGATHEAAATVSARAASIAAESMTGRAASGAAGAETGRTASAAPAGDSKRQLASSSARSNADGSAPAKSTSGRRDSTWGLSPEQQALHKSRLMAFYATHQPAKAHKEHCDTAFGLFGPGVWDELERKYRGKTAGFRPMPTPS